MSHYLPVLIADDEPIFRRYLLSQIDWPALGLQVCAQADNGQTALELAAQHQPSIALLDINMPFVNGLELAEALKQAVPELVFVFLTGYGEFEYSQKALKLGAVDYILKPFEDAELIGALLKAKGLVLRRQEEQQAREQTRSAQEATALAALLQNEQSFEEEQKCRDSLGLSAEDRLCCLLVEIDDVFQRWKEPSELALWKYALQNMLAELLPLQKHFFSSVPAGKHIACLLCQSPCEGEWDEAALLACGTQFCLLTEEHLKFTVTVGLGAAQTGPGAARLSCKQARAAVESKLLQGGNRVIAYTAMEGTAIRYGFYSGEVNEALLRALRAQQPQEVHRLLHEVFGGSITEDMAKESVYGICNGLVSLCLSFLTEQGHAILQVFGEHFFPFSTVRQMDSMPELLAWIQGIYDTALDYCAANRSTKGKNLAQRAQTYIDEHYAAAGLSIETIAGALYINPDYLRSVFKKEMGTTVFGYLNEVRMQHAKELLAQGGRKLNEVAELCGFSDGAYFSRCFKKSTGHAPSTYETLHHR